MTISRDIEKAKGAQVNPGRPWALGSLKREVLGLLSQFSSVEEQENRGSDKQRGEGSKCDPDGHDKGQVKNGTTS